MQFSNFGKRFTQNSGILELMDDLGNALTSDQPINMLGGGNPASIAAVNDVYLDTLQDIVQSQYHAQSAPALNAATNYSTPQGDSRFIDALVAFFNRHYHWGLTREHIALTNGSQNAFFYLFNLFAGCFDEGEKSILLPLTPEYIGYADTHIDGGHFIGIVPKIELTTHQGRTGFFKYRVDFERLAQLDALKSGKIGAICVSRPTNPTGNVLTDDEMAQLDAIAQAHGVPLIIDNAYGMPFPNIIHTPATLTWHDNIILCFSLSKIGLAGLRTGIIVAHPKVVRAVSAMNAIVNLAPTRFGAAVATPLVESDALARLSQTHIRPFYARQAKFAIDCLQQALAGYPLYIHQPEGAIFLWLWFKDLPISSRELYERLKAVGTLIIPSALFFVGVDTSNYRHAHECIRMSIAQDDDTLAQGIACIARVVKAAYDNA